MPVGKRLLGVVGVLLFLALLALGCRQDAAESGDLRAGVEGFFEAILNGDVAALEGYVSDECPAKAEFLERAQELSVLEPVDVTVPEGAMLFDYGEEGVAVAKRAADGPRSSWTASRPTTICRTTCRCCSSWRTATGGW
jgi:hypothetical protein